MWKKQVEEESMKYGWFEEGGCTLLIKVVF